MVFLSYINDLQFLFISNKIYIYIYFFFLNLQYKHQLLWQHQTQYMYTLHCSSLCQQQETKIPQNTKLVGNIMVGLLYVTRVPTNGVLTPLAR